MKGAAIGGLFGGLPGAAIGGLNGYFGITDQIKDWAAGLFGGNSDYAGSGMAGDSYSNDRGFSDPGGWGLGNLGDSYGGFADGSAYGGSGGGSQGGFGGYGNADGSPSNDGPGIW